MNRLFATPTMTLTLRALAHLLRYPDARWLAHLPDLRSALHAEGVIGAARRTEIDRLIDALGHRPLLALEMDYVEIFDRGRRTSLHLFEHVHGDSRDRGPAMLDLISTYEAAGLQLDVAELPDHLCIVLEFASTQPPERARAFLGELSHIVRAIFTALVERRSPYASVLAAVLELAGERAECVQLPEESSLDDSWAEPEAFGGCTSRGQSAPGQPQPIQVFHRRAAVQNAARPGVRP